MNHYYQVGGSLHHDAPSYIVRQSDRELYDALISGEFCYVLHSRQMGKSSLMVRMWHQLQAEGHRCVTIDITNLGSDYITPQQWYIGILAILELQLDLDEPFNASTWWTHHQHLSLVQSLSQYIESLLHQFSDCKIFIFVDEIDSILNLPFTVDDFFAWIRFCYNQRTVNPIYERLSFAIFGVATPNDLIADKQRTPFNIGRAISLRGFQLHEVQPLAHGLQVSASLRPTILQEVLHWTGGQPFLTQKVCQLLVEISRSNPLQQLSLAPGTEKWWIEQIVQHHILTNWESQDEPQHLRTLRDRLLHHHQRTGRLLGIYQKLLQGDIVRSNDSREQLELLLSGLVVKQKNHLVIQCRIYREIFDEAWVNHQLSALRPYSQAFEAWVASQQTDTSRLLRGQALKDARIWSQNKSLSDLDYTFLGNSEELERQAMQQALELEKAKALQQGARFQRYLLGVVSTALVIAAGLSFLSFQQYRRAIAQERATRLSEIRALILASQGNFAADRKLDALVASIKAYQKWRSLSHPPPQLATEVESVLRQNTYGAIEFNRFNHPAAVLCVTIHPNGDLVVTADKSGRLNFWQLDGTLIRSQAAHAGAIHDVQFSRDGTRLASVGEDGRLKLWQADGTPLKAIEAHGRTINHVNFSPDDRHLLSASDDRLLKEWNIEGTLVQTFVGHEGSVLTGAYSPDGTQIASGSLDGTAKLWQRDGTPVRTLSAPGPVDELHFTPDGQQLIGVEWNHAVLFWDRQGNFVRSLLGHTNSPHTLAISPDGQMLASAGQDNTIRLRRRNGELFLVLRGHQATIHDLAFSPDGQILFSASDDGTLQLWRWQHPMVTVFRGHREAVLDVQFAKAEDGKTPILITSSDDRQIRLWNLDGTPRSVLSRDILVWDLEVLPDGRTLLGASSDTNLHLWDLDRLEHRRLAKHDDLVISITLHPRGNILVSTGLDRTIRFWRLDGTSTLALNGLSDVVGAVAFSPNGQSFASVSWDGLLQFWQIGGQPLWNVRAHLGRAISVQLSPDGQQILSGGLDGKIQIWDRRGNLQQVRQAHSQGVNALQFHPDGMMFASASRDRTIGLWDRQGQLLARLNGHQNYVQAISFSPDGRLLASASRDGTAMIWSLDEVRDLDRVLNVACQWVSDYLRTNTTVEASDRGLCDRQISPLSSLEQPPQRQSLLN